MEAKTDRNISLIKDRNSGMTWMNIAIKYKLNSGPYAKQVYDRWVKRLQINK